jgi:hypothetical protein
MKSEAKSAFVLHKNADFTDLNEWCPGAELNHRHADFPSDILIKNIKGLDSQKMENSIRRTIA